MVNKNRVSPEGINEELSPPDQIILGTDSEEDDDDNGIFDDYEPLPTNEEDAQETATAITTDSELNSATDHNLPLITPVENEILKEVWNGPTPKCMDIEMDSKKVAEVKQVMANITLPPGAIPEWANNIPEEQWKEKLFSRLEKLDKI